MRIRILKSKYCYVANNLKEISLLLDQLKAKKAKESKLYYNGNYYYLLSEKLLISNNRKSCAYITGYLDEYATIICENAIEKIRKLL